MAKLSTPCCCGHAAALLRALTSSEKMMLTASNQTLCNALYGAALLSREAAGPKPAAAATAAAPAFGDGAGTPPSGWSSLLAPASALASACLPRLGTFNVQDTANVWWAVATLATLLAPPASTSASAPLRTALTAVRARAAAEPAGGGERFVVPDALLEGLAAAAARHMRGADECRPQAVANMLWGACKMAHYDERMFFAAVQLLTPQLRTLIQTDPRATSTCLWALASLRYPPTGALLSAASRPAAARLRAFDDQSLSNLLWAYGTSGVQAPRLFAAAAEELIRRVDRMSLQFLSISLWAFATVNHLDEAMMAAVAESLTGASGSTSAYPPASAAAPAPEAEGEAGVKAKAKTGSRTTATATGVGPDAKRVVKAGLRQAATPPAPYGSPAVAEAEAAFAERLAACDGRRTQVVGNLAWAYAALGARHEPLVAALTGRAAALAPSLNAQELSNVLYGAARLLPYMADTQPGVLEALLREVDRRLGAHPDRDKHRQPKDPRQLNLPPQQRHGQETSSSPSSGDTPKESTRSAAVEAAAPLPPPPEFSSPPLEGPLTGVASTEYNAVILAGGHHLTARDLAMISWSVAILSPASPTLGRLMTAAVDAVAVTAGRSPDSATNIDFDFRTSDDLPAERRDEDCELEPLQAQPYHLYGLVQLYGANYAACLAAALGGGGRRLEETAGRAELFDAASHNAPAFASVTAAAHDGGVGAPRSAVSALVRAAAAAMRQAQSAAEAFGGGGSHKGASEGFEGAAAAAAGVGSLSPAGERVAASSSGISSVTNIISGSMVRFGPLGACPALFRACRDAWFLTTASTKPSDLQAAVTAVLLDSGGGGGGSIPVSESGSGGRVTAVAQEVLSPDRMLSVDLLVQYDGWLVILEVDGPTHFAVELRAGAEAVAQTGNDAVSQADAGAGRDGGSRGGCRDACCALEPLGDTVLRNRLLAASLGLIADGGHRHRMGSLPRHGQGPFSAASVDPDPWVVESLLQQLSAGRSAWEGAKSSCCLVEGDERGEDREVHEVAEVAEDRAVASDEQGEQARSEDGQVVLAGAGQPESGCPASSRIRGVAVASLSYVEWNAAGAGRKWAACVAPLLCRVCTA